MTLVVDSLVKTFGPVRALDGVSFTVGPGEVFGFLGANGAGKTTTMRICLDVLRPDSGVVTWDGSPNTTLPRGTWGYLPEERGLYAKMRVLDQLVFFASLRGVPAAAARRTALEWLERFRIPDYADRRADELSKGNQQKIQFIAAILHDPAVLLLDEPFTGLDPVNAALLKEAFLEMRDRGKTIVFSTHQMETVEELAESIAIVDAGRIVVVGPDPRRARGERAHLRAARRRGRHGARVARGPRRRARHAPRPRLHGDGGGARTGPGVDPPRGARPRPPRRALRDRRSDDRADLRRARRARGGRRADARGAGRGRRDDPAAPAPGPRDGGAPAVHDTVPTRNGDRLLPNAGIVARREYLQRVRTRSFVLGTVVAHGDRLRGGAHPHARDPSSRASSPRRSPSTRADAGLSFDPVPILERSLNVSASAGSGAPGASLAVARRIRRARLVGRSRREREPRVRRHRRQRLRRGPCGAARRGRTTASWSSRASARATRRSSSSPTWRRTAASRSTCCRARRPSASATVPTSRRSRWRPSRSSSPRPRSTVTPIDPAEADAEPVDHGEPLVHVEHPRDPHLHHRDHVRDVGRDERRGGEGESRDGAHAERRVAPPDARGEGRGHRRGRPHAVRGDPRAPACSASPSRARSPRASCRAPRRTASRSRASRPRCSSCSSCSSRSASPCTR